MLCGEVGASLWGPLRGSPLCAGSFTVGTKALIICQKGRGQLRMASSTGGPIGSPPQGVSHPGTQLETLVYSLLLFQQCCFQESRPAQMSPFVPKVSIPPSPLTSLCSPPRSFSNHAPLPSPLPQVQLQHLRHALVHQPSHWPLCL